MGFELWFSKNTGIRRNGTTFSELQDIFINDITTKYIYERLACCKIDDNSSEIKNTLIERDFDILGVVDNKLRKVGYIKNESLKEGDIREYLLEFSIDQLISESTPLADLFEILTDKEFAFILSGNEIEGIVTRADLNKPIVRIYLFGIVSLYELHLNYWIKQIHINESWKAKLSSERLKSAEDIFQERMGNNDQLTLLECLQICDKKEILRNTESFIERFSYSKSKLKQHLERIEIIRNELAHSHNSIILNLKWPDFVSSIKHVQEFLIKSESIIQQ